MSKYIEVSAKLVVRVGDSILMLRRKDGSYIFPGGHVEWGESLQECLRREAREELGYQLLVKPELVDTYEYISRDEGHHNLILHHLLRLPSRPVLTLGDDEAKSEILWLSKIKLGHIIPRVAFIGKIFSD